MQVAEVELASPVGPLRAGIAPSGLAYPAAHVLVRLHGAPIGVVHVDLRDGDVPADLLLARVDAELGDAVDRHLAGDGLSRPAGVLPVGGLADRGGRTACPRSRTSRRWSASSWRPAAGPACSPTASTGC
jgi:hypothetical protein